jgi:GMP synthase-like glutamine amidotransferase
MPKVYIVGGGYGSYTRLFTDYGWEVLLTPEGADLIQFTGGEDVDPSLYCEGVHHRTYFNKARDTAEAAVFEAYLGKVAMAGICRGGQLLNVLSGGSLYQDVNHHTRPHDILTPDGDYICLATSTHHQMMIPGNGAEVLAIGLESTRREVQPGNNPVIYQGAHDDTEVVYYEGPKGVLCFQPHPEHGPKALKDYYFKLIKDYLGVSVC